MRGVSRATISRHIKGGKLSYELDRDNNKVLQASELLRVYGDDCDFEREEQRGKSKKLNREEGPNQKLTEASFAAIDAVREQQITQYVAQIEHLQQALDKAQESQNRITLLLEQRSTDKNEWKISLEQMTKSLANKTESQIKELREYHNKEIKQLRRALHRERNKTFWQRVFSK